MYIYGSGGDWDYHLTMSRVAIVEVRGCINKVSRTVGLLISHCLNKHLYTIGVVKYPICRAYC